MWHFDTYSLTNDRLKEGHVLENIPYSIYPKSLLEKVLDVKSIKPIIVKRESRKSQPNGNAGIITMTEISMVPLNESVEAPYTDAWGYEFSSRREMLSAQHPKSHKNCPLIYSKCLGKCRLKTLILVLFLSCIIIVISCIYYAAPSSNDFDGSLGPHGSKPGDYPNMGLPVRLNNLTNHSTYFGVDLDWTIDDPQYINHLLNLKSAIFGVKVNLSSQMGDTLNLSGPVNSSGKSLFLSALGILHVVPNVLEWQANLVRGTGAILGIDVFPIGNISFKLLKSFGDQVIQLNKMNLSILVRFAPDMNGNWWTYGQDPQNFVSWFRYLSLSIKNKTNLTAMVWSPAPSNGYPYRRTEFLLRNSTQFTYLDTNKDGVFDSDDNPFSPYYPGDDAVDWIGLSPVYRGPIYPNLFLNSSNTSTTNSSQMHPNINDTLNVLPPKGFIESDNPFGTSFEQQLTGGKVNLYDTYVVKKKKPLILWDVGSAFYLESVGESELLMKSIWYSQIINPFVLKKYSYIKAVILSDLKYHDPLCNNFLVDYSITRNPQVLSAISNQVTLLKANSSLEFAADNSTDSLTLSA